jgi:hypothetical protein
MLTINNTQPDTLLIKVAVNPAAFKAQAGKGVYLIAQAGGKVYYTTACKLDEPVYTVAISKDHFPTGVLRVTLFTEAGEPVNERVVFIRQPDQLLLKVNANKASYAENENVHLDVSANTIGGEAQAGNFSAAVINEDKVPADEMAEPTLLTELLLSPEVHGSIKNPGHYLAYADERSAADLDLLMLTQGYRKLEWKQATDTIRQQPKYMAEDGLTISGTVTTKSGKPVVKGKVSLFCAQILLKVDTLTDENGRFNISGLNVAGKTPMTIKAQNGTSNDVKITLDLPEKTVSHIGAGEILIADTALTPLNAALQKSYRD